MRLYSHGKPKFGLYPSLLPITVIKHLLETSWGGNNPLAHTSGSKFIMKRSQVRKELNSGI